MSWVSHFERGLVLRRSGEGHRAQGRGKGRGVPAPGHSATTLLDLHLSHIQVGALDTRASCQSRWTGSWTRMFQKVQQEGSRFLLL